MESRALKIHGEFETMRKLAEGFSIARFGDGELKLMSGGSALREPRNIKLEAELRSVFATPHPMCLRGILTMNPRSPKHASLTRFLPRMSRFLRDKQEYYSAHISRVDHAPWIESDDYAELAHSIWRDKRAVVVCETEQESAYRAVYLTADEVIHVPCPHREAYAQIDALERAVASYEPQVAVLSIGPTATCLANRLAKRGIQAIDAGRMGKVILRHS